VIRKLLAVLVLVVGLAGVVLVEVVGSGATVDRGTSTHAGPIAGVEVEIDAGRVDVTGGTGADATVERTRHYLGKAPKIDEALVDGVLRLRVECPRFVALGCAADLRLAVPASASLRVRTQSGAVRVDGMSNGVDVSTSAGAVRLTGTAGPVRATTSAGSIDGVDLAPPFLDARTGAGSIRLSLAQPADRVDVRTDAGRIELALPDAQDGYRVTTATGAGKVDVGVAHNPASARAVTARTGAGGISIRPR
jgi:hypothetical protein